MKKIIQILSIIVLIIAVVWAVKSDFDYEPIIVCITSILAIVSTSKFTNRSVIKGKKNKLKQDSRSGAIHSSEIDGEENEVIQL